MQYEGVLRKMPVELGEPIQYFLVFENDFLHVNQILGQQLEIRLMGFHCLNCREDRPIFRQGYCRICFFDIPSAGDWIMKPELSTAHLDQEDRDLQFEKRVQLQPHIVYLANSSNVKVGVTRKSQIPTRWIDQGAHEAIEFAEVPNRYLAGITEVALKGHVSDKTNWRRMLTNTLTDVDLAACRDRLREHLPEEVSENYICNTRETHLHYPVMQYPTRVKSLILDKRPHFNGRLAGIKGQYLIFEDSTVFNIRGSEGYVVGMRVT